MIKEENKLAENNTPIKNFSSAGAEKLREMTENNKMYIDFLKFQGRVFKHNTSVALEFFAQRPETKFIATSEQWRQSGRTIAQGSEAIRFVDSNGKNTDFYDFSQVEENVPPYQWTINKNNANEIKKHLGIPEKTPIISGIINSTLQPVNITSCMSALGIPPKDYRNFSKSFVNAMQIMIAGRLEIGGSNFNIPSDLTALQMLKTDSQKLAFLTYAANTAREALMKIENAAKNVIAEERIEKNDLREMENPDTTRTEERSGRRTPDNTAGNVGEQSDRSQSHESGRSSGLGNNAESTKRQEHEMVSGVQNENGGQSGVLVQVQPDMRTVQPESDGLRTVSGGRTDRDLRNEMDGLHGGKLSASGGENEAVSQVFDSSTVSEQQGGELQGLTGRPVRRDEPTPDGLRGSAEMGTGENVLLGQHGDEGNNFSSGDGSIDEKLNTVFSSVETEKTSTEKADVFVIDDEISDEETLVHITAEIAEKEKQFTDLVNALERRYDLIADTAKEIQELQKIESKLKEKIQEKPITLKDIQTLRDIRPVRKSVQNMLEHEVAQTSKLEKLLHSEMGSKSPYEQRKNNNDWRKDDSKSVQITEIQPKSLPKRINDVRQKDNIKKIERGTFINFDTNMEIIFGKKAVDEIIAKAIQDDKRNVPVEARIAALYQMQELVERAVCFDSQVSEYDHVTSKNKSSNTLFMHQMYGIMKYKDESYLAKLSVEEMYTTDKDNNFNGTSNRIYNVRNIKITPIEANRAFDPAVDNISVTEDTSTSVFISIPQLYEIVKTYDRNFFENPDAVGRDEREAELYLRAEYNDAVAETVGNSTHSEKSELLENVAESRKITKEKAEEVLQQSAEKLTVKRPVTLSERKKILDDFAERNGLGKIQIWKKTGSPSSYRIAETENGDRLFNERLCTLRKGEVLTAEKLRKSIDEFEKSEFFVQYKQTKSENKSVVAEEPAPETKSVNQPEYPYVSVKAGWNYDKYISPELEEKNYTVPEFNDALKKLSERWDSEEYETKSAFVTLTIHISETESFEKRLNAEYQFEKLSERLKFDDDIFDAEVKLRQAVHEAENHATIPELTEKEKAFLNVDIVEFIAKSVIDVDNINKHSDIIQRVQNGEDIHKEFVISLLENQHNFVTTQNNEFTVEYDNDFITAKYENVERQVSYTELENTFFALIEDRHNYAVQDLSYGELKDYEEYLDNQPAMSKSDFISFLAESALNSDKVRNNIDIIMRLQKGEAVHEKLSAAMLENMSNIDIENDKIRAKYFGEVYEISCTDFANAIRIEIGNKRDYSDIVYARINEEDISYINTITNSEYFFDSNNITDSADEKEISLSENKKSAEDLKTGDIIRYDGEIWRITDIRGDFSLNLENTDKNSVMPVRSFIGNWKEQLDRDGFEYVSNFYENMENVRIDEANSEIHHDTNNPETENIMPKTRFTALSEEAKRYYYEFYPPNRPSTTPKETPWGEVNSCHELGKGIFRVSTPSHGGIMIRSSLADKILSPEARKVGFKEKGFHCYEEDCDACVAERELLDKGIMQVPDYYNNGAESYNENINEELQMWHTDYWNKREQAIFNALPEEKQAEITGQMSLSDYSDVPNFDENILQETEFTQERIADQLTNEHESQALIRIETFGEEHYFKIRPVLKP